MYAKKYDEAIKYGQRALELDPGDQSPLLMLGESYALKGMYEEAIDILQKVKSPERDAIFALHLTGYIYALTDKRAKAYRVIEELRRLEKQYADSPYDMAIIYVALKENELALESLEKASARPLRLLIPILFDPKLDPLRSSPKFDELKRRYAQALQSQSASTMK